jgi:hypothetical protein
MSTEYNQLLQIRKEKENQQRVLVQQLTQEIEEKKPMLAVLEKSMTLFKQQKTTMESVFFDQIKGQQVKPDSLSEYQDKVKQITRFDSDLDAKYQMIVDDIESAKSRLAQAHQDLEAAKNNVEKIGVLVDEQQMVINKERIRKEDSQSDELATESWNRQQ